jgi:hypothetical protein
LLNGRPLIDTALPSQNFVLIGKDVLRDPNFGLGMASGDFDDLTGASNVAGLRWQCRLELHEQVDVGDWLQNFLGQCGGYITFNGRKVQIGIKHDLETASAGFATTLSGSGGRRIHKDDVRVSFSSSDELLNQVNVAYRLANRHIRKLIAYDNNAQTRAGGNIRKVQRDDLEFDCLFDADQVAIAAAILLREEQNANMFIDFEVPLAEGLDVTPGDLIQVFSEDIPNNGTNHVFRVIAQPFIVAEEPLIGFHCQVYFGSVYSYSTAGIGIDLIRSGSDVSTTGRPPDVVPASLALIEKVAGDLEGTQAHIRAIFTYPTVDLAADQADGIFREFPIRSVQLFWRYTDEGLNEWKIGKEVQYPSTQGDFNIPFIKSKSIQVAFVALGLNRSHGPLGYVPDPTKITALTADLSAIAGAASVGDSGPFATGDVTRTEFELDKLSGKAAGSLSFVTSAGNRVPQFDTVAIAHPNKTQIAVAKQNYPTLTLSLTPPKFTYPIVTGFQVRQRKDGVRCRWAPIGAENKKEFLLYWSPDSDAGTNPAKLSLALPAWYVTDPQSPPAGVNLVALNKQHDLIMQEDIGSAGTPVFARVCATNGKNNYSSTLSALGSNSSLGGELPPTDAPSTPLAGLIITNTVNLATSEADALTVFRIFASQADNAKTFAQTGATEIVIVYRLNGDTKDRTWLHVVDDVTAASVDVSVIDTLGLNRIWRRTIARNTGGPTKSPIASVQYFAGGRVTNAALITGLSITSVAAIDAHHSYINFGFTQPAVPVLLARSLLFQKLAGEAVFSKEDHDSLLVDESLQTAGAKTDKIKAKHPKNNAAQYFVRLVSVDGTTIDSATFNSTSPREDSAAPNNGVAIAAPSVKLKAKGLVGNFDTAYPQTDTNDFNVVVIHDNNLTGTGRKFFDPFNGTWVATYADGTTELKIGKAGHFLWPIDKSALYVGGRTTVFFRVGIHNQFAGGSTTYSADLGASVTQAGSDQDPVATDSGVPTWSAGPVIFWDAKGGLQIQVPLPATNFNTLKDIQVVLWDGVSVFYNFLTKAAAASEAAARYSIGQAGTMEHGTKKRKLTAVFSPTGQPRAYAYAVNSQGASVKSPDSAPIVLSGALEVYSDGRDSIVTLDVGTLMSASPLQLVDHTDFLAGEFIGGQNTLSGWARWTSAGAEGAIDDTANSIQWNINEHSVSFRAIDRWLVSDNRDTTPGATRGFEETCLIGDVFAFGCQLKSPNTTFTAFDARVFLVDGLHQGLGTLIPVQLLPGETIGSVYQMFGAAGITLGVLPAGADKNIYLAIAIISSTPAIDASHLLTLDRVILNRGRTLFAHTQRPQLENRKPYSATPAAASQIDLGSSFGAQSGFFNEGIGGRFSTL